MPREHSRHQDLQVCLALKFLQVIGFAIGMLESVAFNIFR
jgi:hypothetical protein